MNKKSVLVVGATGFVGSSLVKKLVEIGPFKVRGICRNNYDYFEGAKIVKADLYNLEEIEDILEGVDYAVYLAHSTFPTARLDQGDYQNYDLIMADNFARIAKKSKLKQIIYLGGFISYEKSPSKNSQNRVNRLEIEKILSSSGIPITILRVGMILGQEGPAITLLMRLVEKLKFIPIPPSAKRLTWPIDILNVVDYIEYCLGNYETFNKNFDLIGAETLSYENLLKKIVDAQKLKRTFIQVPDLPNGLSSWILKQFAHSPLALEHPLMESLSESLAPKAECQLNSNKIQKITVLESLQRINLKLKKKAHKKKRESGGPNSVRSIQRMKLPPNVRADLISFTYLHWLTRYFKFFLKVEKNLEFLHIKSFFLKTPLLTLEHAYSRSGIDRQLLFIRSGLLVKNQNKFHPKSSEAVLEFREVLDGQFFLVAIHNYRPSLPWWIYIPTQSWIHTIVMKSFSKWLNPKVT